MGDGVTVVVEGGEELLRALRRAGVNVDSALEAAAMLGAAVMEDAMVPLAPGPGIATEVTEKGPGYVAVDVGPDEDHWYYRFFETGTGPHAITGSPWLAWDDVVTRRVSHPGMAARPFMRPAFDGSSGAAAETVGEELRRVLSKT